MKTRRIYAHTLQVGDTIAIACSIGELHPIVTLDTVTDVQVDWEDKNVWVETTYDMGDGTKNGFKGLRLTDRVTLIKRPRKA